jgi:glyoxylase-like metal-dependent hydrolase (beta-lactamase superfamily II)
MRYLLLILVAVTTYTVAEENSTTLQIQQIESGVYLHTSYKMIGEYGLVDSNGLVVVNGNQAIIIDTPWSEDDTVKLLSWIKEKGFNVEASISTHFHEDRTAGISVLNSESIPTYTSELTNEILIREGKPTATNVFPNSEFSWFEGLIEVFYPGAGHTEDNLVVWLPESRILFGGCLLRSLEWKGLGFTEDANVNSWADSIREIQSKYPKIESIVPGHGSTGDISILGHTIELAENASNKSIPSE